VVKVNAGKAAVDKAVVEDSSAVDKGGNVPVPDKVFRPVDSPGDNAKVRRKDNHKDNRKDNPPLLHKAEKLPKGKKGNRHRPRSCRCRRRMRMTLR